MSDQVVYNKPSGQTDQNNNLLLRVLLGAVVVIIFLFAIFRNPQSTQIPQPTTVATPTVQL